MYKKFFKRLFDVLISFIALFVLSPLLISVVLWLYVANKGAVFFTPVRPGRNKKLFRIFKFKSMTDERDEHGKLLPDAQRVTSAGRFVRSTSIDELPQLLNVLKGDMSFVGPRPLAANYLPYYNEEESRRFEVRPGITGWAQVNGRTSVTWDKKMSLDVEYVNRLSLWFDLKILFVTFYKVVKKENVEVSPDVDFLYFYDFREAQWAKQGREDLIKEARIKRVQINPFEKKI